ncbi:MAG: DUF975 domain-containing protein [Xenococcaceae cyanobacterium]
MSKSPIPSQPIGPLSIGNVVSAGLRIYRDHFKLYYSLAFTAYLWVLVPIYGWAKFSAILGLISRLVFSEIIERPETVNEARRHVNPRMWNFFLAGLLVSLIFSAAMLGVVIVFGIFFGILGILLTAIFEQNLAAVVILTLLGLIAFIALIFGYIWLYSRLSIVELPIAIENQGDPGGAIGRSWNLTQGFVLRLQGIFLVAFLTTLPVSIVVQIADNIIQVVLAILLPQDSGIFVLLYVLLILSLSFASGALLIPFWQAIKAVIYYDLRSRREGLDLQIRDS